MSNYAVVDAFGLIINRIAYADPTQWPNEARQNIVKETDTAYQMGATLIGGVYTPQSVAAAPPPPITAVTPRQARLALLGAGLLSSVETLVTQAGGATQITWDYASTIERNDPLITSLSAGLGLTSAQIDALFLTASTL